MTDLGDQATVREAKRKSKRREAERLDVLRSVLGTTQGRRFVYDLLAQCHVHRSSFSTDVAAMAFAEGERNIGLWLEAQVTFAAPDQYILMLKEQKDADELEDRVVGDRLARTGRPSDSGDAGTGERDDTHDYDNDAI